MVVAIKLIGQMDGIQEELLRLAKSQSGGSSGAAICTTAASLARRACVAAVACGVPGGPSSRPFLLTPYGVNGRRQPDRGAVPSNGYK